MKIDIWLDAENAYSRKLIACRLWDNVPRIGETIDLLIEGENLSHKIKNVRWLGDERPVVILDVERS